MAILKNDLHITLKNWFYRKLFLSLYVPLDHTTFVWNIFVLNLRILK